MHSFINWSNHLTIHPLVHPSIHLSVSPFTHLSPHCSIYLSISTPFTFMSMHSSIHPTLSSIHPPMYVSITCAVNFYIHYFFSTYWLFPTSICQYFQFLFINRFSIVQSINTSFYAVKAGRPFCWSRLWSLWWVLNCMGSSTEPLHVSHSVFMFCWGSLCSAWMNMSKLSSYPSGRNPYLKLVSLQCSTKRLWIKHSWA